MENLLKEGLENKLSPLEITAIVLSVVVFIVFCIILYINPIVLQFFTTTIPNSIMFLFMSISNLFMPFFKSISDFSQSLSLDKELRYSYIKYIFLYAIIITLTVLYFLNLKDNQLFLNIAVFKNPVFYYSIAIIIPLFIIFYFILPYLRGGNINKYAVIGSIIFFLFAMLMFYLYTNLSTEQLSYISWVLTGFFLLITVNALAIFFYIFSNYLKTMTGWAGFFVYFIFYIPCLLIDFIEYVKAEFKATSNTVYILFIIELLLILLYNYLPSILNKVLNSNGKPLLKNVEFLNKEHVLATGEEFKKNKVVSDDKLLKEDEEVIVKTFNKNYAVSMWTFINVQSKNFRAYSDEANIFDYGNGKPKITYNYDLSNNYVKNKYRIYFTDENNDKINNYHDFTMLDQKWNNIVVNYTSTTVDLFINGTIEKTFYFKDNFTPPRYFSDDVIKVGQENGLHGSICNVKYFFRPQTKYEIANNYNLLMSSNPPVFMEE